MLALESLTQPPHAQPMMDGSTISGCASVWHGTQRWTVWREDSKHWLLQSVELEADFGHELVMESEVGATELSRKE